MSDVFLADDLSGALDAAAAFHHAGRRVIIPLSLAAWPTAIGTDIVGLTTETRNAPPHEAAAVVARVLAEARTRGSRVLYKKIDSTLRGPVAAEIAALAAAIPDARILFAPANPGAGRTVRDGVLLVHGIPVSETEFARDPVSPVTESRIQRLLSGSLNIRLVIADAVSDADLNRAVAAMAEQNQTWIAVGSGALARPVAQHFKIADEAVRPLVPAALPTGPMLFVCGSAHAGNRKQAEALARERGIPLHELALAEPASAAAAVGSSVRGVGGAALLLESKRGDREVAVRTIAEVSAKTIRATGTRRIFATGGETAAALCRELGVGALEFLAEIESGLSVSHAESAIGPLRIAIKPGGFGDERSWVRAWDALRGSAGSSPTG